MRRSKESSVIYEIVLDIENVSRGLWVTQEVATKGLGDGRVAAHWAEHWGARVGLLIKSENSNEPGFDLKTTVSGLSAKFSSKCLSKSGLKFQDSKYTGSKRTCDFERLMESLNGAEYVHVVDITAIPLVRIIPIHSRLLRREVTAGRLTCSGWSRQKLYEFLDREYECQVETAVRNPDEALPNVA